MLLVIDGGSDYTATVVRRALRAGWQTGVVASTRHTAGMVIAGENKANTMVAGLFDPEGVLVRLKQRRWRTSGVLAVGPYQPVVAAVATGYNLPHLAQDVAALRWDRPAQKRWLKAGSINVPPFGRQGGAGMVKARSPLDGESARLEANAPLPVKRGRFIEAWAAGEQVAAFGIVWGGVVVMAALADKNPSTSVYTAPAAYEQNSATRRGIEAVLNRFVSLTGMEQGVVRATFAVGMEITLISLAAGELDGVVGVLGEGYGVKLLEAAFAAACGRLPSGYLLPDAGREMKTVKRKVLC